MVSIKVPPLGESITEATVSRWLKNEGEAVAAGETLVELETDKITVEVPALKAGVLAKRARAEGDVVGVNDELGQLDDAARAPAAAPPAAPTAAPAAATAVPPAAPAAATAAPPAAPSAAPPAAPAPSPAPAAPSPAIASPQPPRSPSPSRSPAAASPAARSAPSARKLADQAGIDLGAVAGTGRGGVVSRADVVAASATSPAPTSAPAPAPTPAPAPGPAPRAGTPATGPNVVPTQFAMQRPASETLREEREKMTTRRKRIAENLLAAQRNTASLTTFNEIDMSAVSALRERMKERVEQTHGIKLTFMAFFARAAVIALDQFRAVNASVDGDTIVYHNFVNLGIAVASDAGLVVPNLKDAHRMGVLALAKEIADTATRARDGRLTIDDLTGGTFTLTNGGVFGSLLSTPIINYPQAGILGLHKIQDRPVVADGQVVVRPMMYVALSYDHRIIDGQQAVLFLVRVKELMEDPEAMLIS